MRIVPDTNLVISGMLWGGPPRAVIDLIDENWVKCFTSPAIIVELKRVLSYPRMLRRLRMIGNGPEDVERKFREISEMVFPFEPPQVIVGSDPSDDIFLLTAVAAQADFVVTDDHHLLDLKRFDNIDIVTPADFLKILSRHTR
jgi:putative PIN family toxin of toxin-antitoxin system